mmetsp:Transcript_4888/g.10789  ORF Transcript_4888/g.10789 Transcript_4888/m.10789 type:complete len:261 (-) Transcript_4888:100-882(-)
MADVQYWDDTLTDEVQSIRQLLNTAEGKSNMDKASALDRAEKKLRAANGTKKSYKMETRLVADPNQKRMYENKLSRLSEELSSCANDLKAMKGGMQRGELFVGARGKSSRGGGEYGEMSGEEAGDSMLSDMNNIQDKTKNSLANTKHMVAASKEVGEATMEELLRQREQIRNVDNEAMRIEDNLQRADKLIKTFGKRMATDRFIQCFACINILLLVGVVIYTILKKGSLTGGENEGAPASPVGGRLLRGLLGEDEEESSY